MIPRHAGLCKIHALNIQMRSKEKRMIHKGSSNIIQTCLIFVIEIYPVVTNIDEKTDKKQLPK